MLQPEVSQCSLNGKYKLFVNKTYFFLYLLSVINICLFIVTKITMYTELSQIIIFTIGIGDLTIIKLTLYRRLLNQ